MKVLHDWDMSRYKRTRDAMRDSFDLLKYCASRKTNIITSPSWIYEEKRLAALAITKLDKLLGIETIWGLTQEVMTKYPTLKQDLRGLDVRLHDHINPGGTIAIPVWKPPLENSEGIDKLYDSHWPQPIPKDYAVWHIDYFYSNRAWLNYLEFLERLLSKQS